MLWRKNDRKERRKRVEKTGKRKEGKQKRQYEKEKNRKKGTESMNALSNEGRK